MRQMKMLLVMLLMGIGIVEATPIVNMEYTVASVGLNVWQYDYTIRVSSSSPESVWLTDLMVPTGVYDITVPANWDTMSMPGVVEWYSSGHPYDIMPGNMLSGFGYRIIQPHGNIAFYASGSDINTGLPTHGQTQGQTTPVPEPATIALLGMGVIIIHRYRKKLKECAI